MGLMGAYLYLRPGLPDVASLKTVKLQTPLRVLSADGLLIAEFGEKRRTPVKIESVPQIIIQAFLAAEDDNFRNHIGIDPLGLIRAAWQLVSSGHIQSGGSTITMQVAKNYFLSHERTFIRKFREILLALEIERQLTKDQILELYLNVIFLGQRSYGIAAASQIYYGKNLLDLTIPQAAMIAGLPKAPSRNNPITNPSKAKERRDWILKRMHKLGYLKQIELTEALNQSLTARLYGIPIELSAPYVAEEARRVAVKLFGETAYTDGIVIKTTILGDWQKASEEAVLKGLLEYDKRHGWRGAEARLKGELVSDWVKSLKSVPKLGPLLPSVVVETGEKHIVVTLADGREALIEEQGFSWARTYKTVNRIGPKIKDARNLATPGDLVRVMRVGKEWHLAQKPQVESGLIALDPSTGAIRAMIGGFDFQKSKFNRATQGGRLVGSGIKPIIYTAALESGMTPATLINDSPVVFRETEGDKPWRPRNSGGKFLGPTRLRKALYRSRNLVSVRLVREIGIPAILELAERTGLPIEKLPADLSISLGTASLTPLEMASTYAVFANGGYKVHRHLIMSVSNAEGELLFKTNPVFVCKQSCEDLNTSVDIEADSGLKPVSVKHFPKMNFNKKMAPQIIDSRTHFLINDMLIDVIKKGTGRRALALKRNDIAGKTGTTNEQFDAWFNGYHPNVVASVWVGFDKPQTLGKSEYGGRAALPIWIDFMQSVLKKENEAIFHPPEGVIATRIDPNTGRRATANQSNTVMEYFLAENPPDVQSKQITQPALVGEKPLTTQDLF